MTDAPAADTSSTADIKRERAAQARALLGRLAERYPACFTRDAAKVRPLAIGMQQKLRAELAAAPEFENIPGWQVRQALAIYTRSTDYLKAIVERRPRINLDGSTAGEVTEEEQAHARTRLDELMAARAARRPKRQQRQGARQKPAERRPSAEEIRQRKLEQLAAKFSRG